MADYSEAVLSWWRANGGSFKVWALAARIRLRHFAQRPRHANASSRCLSGCLFGEQQVRSLADLIQASLMLNYHDRAAG